MAKKKLRQIFQLRVTLRDIAPPIWRSVQMPEDTKLPRLHKILQLLFNWENYHLHDFVVGGRAYSVPDPDDEHFERSVSDERHVPLDSIVTRTGDSFDYLYDFGDGWRHGVVLEAILLPSPDVLYPLCVDGARNGPPEDSGGPFGYARYVEALADRRHKEHMEMLNWRGPFNPEAFSLKQANDALKKAFHRRPASKRTINSGSRKINHAAKYALVMEGLAGPRKKRIQPGTLLPLKLTDRERELILKHTFSPDELTLQLRIVPQRGKQAVARYTLADLDELAGYIAAEANHAKNRKLQKELDGIFDKIRVLLDSHTDEEM